jgi:hypothetical protein
MTAEPDTPAEEPTTDPPLEPEQPAPDEEQERLPDNDDGEEGEE